MAQQIFGENAATQEVLVGAVEGRATSGVARLKELVHGERALLVEVRYEAGMTAPPHSHDHESLCYCVSGRIRSIVDGVPYELGPGDAVLHPVDVVHSTEVLEDSVWIEVKTPPVRTW